MDYTRSMGVASYSRAPVSYCASTVPVEAVTPIEVGIAVDTRVKKVQYFCSTRRRRSQDILELYCSFCTWSEPRSSLCSITHPDISCHKTLCTSTLWARISHLASRIKIIQSRLVWALCFWCTQVPQVLRYYAAVPVLGSVKASSEQIGRARCSATTGRLLCL